MFPGGPTAGKRACKLQQHVFFRVGARPERGANPLAWRLAQRNRSAGPKVVEHPRPMPNDP